MLRVKVKSVIHILIRHLEIFLGAKFSFTME